MGVDSQVRSDIPHLGHPFGRETASDMLKDDVIELVFQDTEALLLCEILEELGIVSHFELCCVRVKTDTSGRYGGSRSLLNTTGQCSKEGFALQQLESVAVKIKC